MAQLNTNHDNDEADTRQSNDTPNELQGNAHSENQIAAAMGGGETIPS